MSGPMAMRDRITIPEVVEDFAAYYRKHGNGAWGSLHIILDDFNVKNSSVQFCIDSAVHDGDVDGERLGRILLTMTKSQRLRLPGKVWELVNGRR